MKIWIARHGQTRLNLEKRMQGLTDEPLNETGIRQAEEARKRIGDVRFDAVYSSPLDRAIVTGSIIGNVSREEIRIDQRLIEVDFGRYEQKKFIAMGPLMSAYWAVPEIFPGPRTVESIGDLEKEDYDNVLVACHGGIMRALTGYLDGRRNGLWWRPKPRNCEIRVFESIDGKHQFLRSYLEDDRD